MVATSLPHRGRRRLVALRDALAAMTDHVGELVEAESPSADRAALERCAVALAELGRRVTGRGPRHVEVEGRRHLLWEARAEPSILLLGHYDTVWPLGTLTRLPFSVREGVARGPGVFDMKAGIVQGFHAVGALDDGAAAHVAILLTADEELGSATSRALVEATARASCAVLVLEPSGGGAVKLGRKGTAMYDLTVTGRAAHAGLAPETGVNALLEAAHLALDAARLANRDRGTTVVPTLVEAGSAANVVPARAKLTLDIRAGSLAELDRVDAALRDRRPALAEAAVAVAGGTNRPPMETSASAALFALARAAAADLDLGPLDGVVVGGASDGNFTAALGVPTLDGLGAVGDGAHAESEHTVVAAMPERAALLCALVDAVLAGGLEDAGA